MDRRLSRGYLEAMGVTVWRLRPAAAEQDDPAPTDAEAEARHKVHLTAGSTAAVLVAAQAAVVTDLADEDAAMMVPGIPSEVATAEMDWELLQKAVASCRACALCKTRNKTVFGVGNRKARLMIIGEAPGADEDRQGEPFVGRAGHLLDRMLAAVGLVREQVFIANILKCRPPGNRDPRPDEALSCEPFLMRQIALVQPQVLLSVGKISAQNLLKTDSPVGRMRGRWFELGPERIPLRVTYHPSYLLRSPEQKGRAWEDLQEVARRLRGSSDLAGDAVRD